jgi:hypothetical protein
MDRPEDYAIQQLLDELAEVDGLNDDDRELLLRLANTVVSEHDRWLHAMFRRLRERDRAREHLRAVCCHSEGCDPCSWNPPETCGVFTALADEPLAKPLVGTYEPPTNKFRLLLSNSAAMVAIDPTDAGAIANLSLIVQMAIDGPDPDGDRQCYGWDEDIPAVIILDAASAEKVERLLEESPEPNEALKTLMASKPPWRNPK